MYSVLFLSEYHASAFSSVLLCKYKGKGFIWATFSRKIYLSAFLIEHGIFVDFISLNFKLFSIQY